MSYLAIKLLRMSVLGLLAGMYLVAGHAGELPLPKGKVILTVSGKIENTNGPGQAEFDLDMLEALGVSDLKTSTPWTDGIPVFEGVLASRLMEAVGPLGDSVSARAINDYAVKLPLSDFDSYPALFALKRDGDYLRVRTKGPLWLVYPWDHYPELDDNIFRERSIWQINRMIIE